VRFANRYYTLIAILLIVVLAGCAPRLIPHAEDTTPHEPMRVCSESPEKSAEIFLEGASVLPEIDEAAKIIRRVIPDGVWILSIFEKGIEMVRALLRHPASDGDNAVSATFKLDATSQEVPGVLRAGVERTISITPHSGPNADRTREEVEGRTFKVFYDPKTNCITRVISIDTEWKQVR